MTLQEANEFMRELGYSLPEVKEPIDMLPLVLEVVAHLDGRLSFVEDMLFARGEGDYDH